jgi:quinone-modifying oxidoreductase subunit QmoB
MKGKTWVYICSGCGIGEAIDVEALKSGVEGECQLAGCAAHPFLCGEEGVALIRKDVEAEPACNVVVAACSPRVKARAFDMGPETLVERANLREHVAWSHEPNDEDTQMLADDTVRMSVVKAEKGSIPQPHIEETLYRSILVVGGGTTGLSAALDCAKAGYETVLVEKEPELGGWVGGLHRDAPAGPPYDKAEGPTAAALAETVKGQSAIQVLLSAEIEKISGQPGQFEVAVKHGDSSTDLKIGSIILATGARPYDASKLGHLGAKGENVITHAELEAMAKEGKIVRPSDGKAPQSVAFIQCAGSRDADHLPYCSTTCCVESLKQAQYVREQLPDTKVYVLYKDLRTPGQLEDFYRAVQEDEGIFLTKCQVDSVTEEPDKALSVGMSEALLGENVRVKADLLVLATGMTPSTLDNGILRLQYRLGEDLPVDDYGFPNSHFICFPYETRRTGIYAAGAVRQPMSSASAMSDASGAALKAIQSIEMTSRGATVHPRAGDVTCPDFSLQRCTQCKRCTEECPFGTLDEDEKFTPLLNTTRCRRCGICMGACPERIINFADYSIDMVGSMIKAVNVPDEFEEKPRVLVLVCENDAYPAFDLAALKRRTYSSMARLIPVRCLGSVNVVWIKDALSCGFDGILMIGCKSGDDYQCHFITGSELMGTRSENIQETLDKLMLEGERVRLEELALDEYDRVPDLINEFVETIEEIGPNPFKGM